MSGVSSINEGTAIYTVADIQSMLIKASINEVDIGRVKPNMPVVISVDAFPYKRFEGTLTHISPAARLKDKIKVFDVEVTLKEQTGEFRAGMTANIELRGERAEKVLAVPVEAVFKKEDKQVVYVAPFANQKAITLETQVDVIDALTALATVRFVDELSEAVQDDAPGSPAKGSEVVLLGPLVTTGSVTEVEAQRYASETDQVRYRFRVTSTADGGWEATQVEAVDVPPTTSS